MGLRNLAEALNNPLYVKHAQDGSYPQRQGGNLVQVPASEVLEIGRDRGPRVLIGYFGSFPTRIAILGEDVPSIKQLLDDLRLPSSYRPHSGEAPFQFLRSRAATVEGGLPYFELEVPSGNEMEYQRVLQKLVEVHARKDATLQRT